MPSFRDLYNETIAKDLQKQFGFKSIMRVPKITKITLNMGVGEAIADKKIIIHALNDLAAIAGQKPVATKARKSVAAFKIREGWPIGAKVTLRGNKMYEFLERLVCIAIPRIRDFRGFSGKGFDGTGNYNLGIKEQIVFPEVNYDEIDTLRGLNIAITTTARTNEEARALLLAFNFPLKEA